jgi:hypothetical protein
MIINEVIWYNGNAYKVLRRIKEHNVSPKGVLNKEMLDEWKNCIGADHVLKQNDDFYLCEIILEATIIEDEIETLVEESVVPLVEESVVPNEENV